MTAPRQPSHETALEQLARYWRTHSAWTGGLLFADPATENPASPIKSNLYLHTLPRKEFRLTPGVVLSMAPDVAIAGNDATMRLGVSLNAHGETMSQCVALLNDLRRLVRPDGRAWSAPSVTSSGAFDPTGVIGVPDVFVGVDADLWRYVSISIRADIQAVRFGPSDDPSPEGEAVARLDLSCAVVPDIAPASVMAFSVHMPSSSATVATVTRDVDTLTLSFAGGGPIQTDAFDLTLANFDTLGELRAAIAALGTWIVADVDATLDARPSVEMLPLNNLNAINTSGKADIKLWP